MFLNIFVDSWQDREQPKDQAQQDMGGAERRDFSLQLRSVSSILLLPLSQMYWLCIGMSNPDV